MSLVPHDGTWHQLSHVADSHERARLRCRCMACHRDIMPGRVQVRYDAWQNTYHFILECHGDHATYVLTPEVFAGLPEGENIALVLSPDEAHLEINSKASKTVKPPPPPPPKRKGRLLSL